MKKLLLWLVPGLAILGLDRIAKWLLSDVQRVLIPGVLALTPAHNTGMAMGMFQGNALWIVVFSAALLGVFVWLIIGMRPKGLAALSISLIAGGALGNVIDRLYYGYVIDMIEILFVDFYIFNVADIGVVCGVIGCGISLLFRPRDWREK
ncbi:MAG: signal peptidase II [Clostridiales bacterium]|nr:signal peptidase II [Clostridiales bacterium]